MDRLTNLRNLIDRADQCYYNENGRGGISDVAYDTLKRDLRDLNPNDERFSRVGAPVSKDGHRKIVKHARLIGSLNDAMTEAEFHAWWPGPCEGSLKMDGLTLENTIVDGVLVTSVTRGDGSEGEDVTANAVQMQGLPRQLAAKFTGQVRGEVYLRVSDLEAINKTLIEEGEEPYENVRNAASGIIRSDDGRFADRLMFAAHGINDPSGGLCIDRHFRAYNALKLLGFAVVETCYCETVYEAVAYYKAVEQRRPALDFWIDGVVFLMNDLGAFAAAGVVNKRPKGGIAFKFPPEEAVTELKDVVLTVGHTGKIIPTAVLEPVRIGGTTVSSALLNNWEEIRRLGVVFHDKVVVVKAGDIIPKIIRVAEQYLAGAANDCRSFEISQPRECPVCKGAVGKNVNTDGSQTADLYCQNPECSAKSTGKIARWVKSLDIKGLGDEVLDALTAGPVKTIADLYMLRLLKTQTGWDLADMPINDKRLGNRRAASILAEIEKTRALTIDQFLGSLGIKHLGKRRVELIREAWRKLHKELFFGDLSKLLDSPEGWCSHRIGSSVGILVENSDLLGIPGIAVEIQNDLYAKRPLIDELLKHISIKSQTPKPAVTSGPLVGKVFAFTGFRPDDDLAAKVTAAGGTIAEDLSKTCTHLVQADASKESSKTKKAKGWGLAVIGKDQLLALLAA